MVSSCSLLSTVASAVIVGSIGVTVTAADVDDDDDATTAFFTLAPELVVAVAAVAVVVVFERKEKDVFTPGSSIDTR